MPFILLFSFILIALEGCGLFEEEVVETSPPVYNRLIPIDPDTGGEIPPGDPNTDPTDPGEEVVLDLVSATRFSGGLGLRLSLAIPDAGNDS